MYGARWLLEILGKHFVKYMIVYALYCTPETNKI